MNFVDPYGLDPRGWLSPFPSHPWNSNDIFNLNNHVLRCHVATHNDPVENLIGAAVFGGPLFVLATAEAAPVVVKASQTVTTTILANPTAIPKIAEFIEGAVTPGPPDPDPYSYAGSAARYALDKWREINGK